MVTPRLETRLLYKEFILQLTDESVVSSLNSPVTLEKLPSFIREDRTPAAASPTGRPFHQGFFRHAVQVIDGVPNFWIAYADFAGGPGNGAINSDLLQQIDTFKIQLFSVLKLKKELSRHFMPVVSHYQYPFQRDPTAYENCVSGSDMRDFCISSNELCKMISKELPDGRIVTALSRKRCAATSHLNKMRKPHAGQHGAKERRSDMGEYPCVV